MEEVLQTISRFLSDVRILNDGTGKRMKEFKSCNTEAISGLKNYMNSHQTIIDILKI